MTFWRMTLYSDTLHWSYITPIVFPITDLDLITTLDFSIEHLQRLRHANRGRLLLGHLRTSRFQTSLDTSVLFITKDVCVLHFYNLFA